MKGWTADAVAKLEKIKPSSPNQENVKPKRGHGKHEEILQIQVANYMKWKHPDIIFRSDYAAGCKLTMGQAVRNKKMQWGRAYPDFFIAKPVLIGHSIGYKLWSGLFLELKKDKSEVYKKNGDYVKNDHIKEQVLMMNKLIAAGYKCMFACGFDEAVKIIEDYLNGK